MSTDVVIVGSGPAGLSLALGLARTGAKVEIIDEQPAPGGQIYRASERNVGNRDFLDWLGPDYATGLDLVNEARKTAGITWRPGTAVWDIRCQSHGCELGLLAEGKTSVAGAKHVALATGAMERPTPFPGWTLPGVMGIGAAQTLLKESRLLPEDGVVLAGQGPLLYLYASQILSAGVRPEAILDFAPRWTNIANLLPLALAAPGSAGILLKGLRLRGNIARARIPHLYGVRQIEAQGSDALKSVSFRHRGQTRKIDTSLLLVHDGIVPNIHMSLAAGCAHRWSHDQASWVPRLDADGRTSCDGLWVLGDGARIMGADAAVLQGRIMARRIAAAMGLPGDEMADTDRADRKSLRRIAVLRRFLDRQYAPATQYAMLPDETTICRCEAVKAGEIRALTENGCIGPNQLRAFSRAGMGPCMGRQCGNAIGGIMAAQSGRSVAEIGHFTIRMPLKPLSLSELASLGDDELQPL